MKARLRVKTLEELGGERPAEWNNKGLMDYLYGKVVEGESTQEDEFSWKVRAEPNEYNFDYWWLLDSDVNILSQELIITYQIDDPGEPAAGLNSFSDVVTVTVESGDPGGEKGEFVDAMRKFLLAWYDGAKVVLVE
jgi:hypothetical protein